MIKVRRRQTERTRRPVCTNGWRAGKKNYRNREE